MMNSQLQSNTEKQEERVKFYPGGCVSGCRTRRQPQAAEEHSNQEAGGRVLSSLIAGKASQDGGGPSPELVLPGRSLAPASASPRSSTLHSTQLSHD